MLAALVGAPGVVVLTVNMSMRPMIVTSGGLIATATVDRHCAQPRN
jgi:hypothetical protein